MKIIRLDTQHLTYADYLNWPDSQQGELINGIAYVREPPAPSRVHQELVVELCYQIRGALEGNSCRAYVAPFDVRLPGADEADEQIDTVVQPDVLIVRDRRKLDKRGMRGAPDWVAEVLSPGTSRHDQIVKLPVYERAGVLEVWLIDPIDLKLTIYRLEGGRYGPGAILELRGRTTLSAVPGITIDWDRLLARVE